MKKRHIYAIITSVAIILVLTALPAVAQKGRQGGTVVDENGAPIEGAVVKFDKVQTSAGRNNLEEKTDAKGNFVFAAINGGDWKLTIEHPGYVPHVQIIKVSTFNRNDDITIKLQKMEEVGGDNAREDAQAAIAAGKEQMEKGEYDAAIATFEEFYEKYPSATIIYAYIGDAYVAKGNIEKAKEAYEVVLQDSPNNAAALKGLGDIYVKAFDYAKAHEYYKVLAQVEKTNPGILYIAAEVANSAGDYDSAVSFYEQFLALEQGTSKTANALVTVGYIYTTMGECDKAEEAFTKYTELVPDEATAAALKQEVENCRNAKK